MKKLILMSLVSIALFGCGDKKVTEDMLIGDWGCTFARYNAKWENGLFQDFDASHGKATNKTLVRFYTKDNQLWVESEKKVNPFNLNYFSGESSISKSAFGITTKNNNSIEYISSDKFKIKTIYESRDEVDETNNNKEKTELICERIME